ncbi:LysR family transcriptional regulator [Psychrobacillus sp. NPDC096623]|uniref:LysR family transcriptional regulator n=1 Tax=Psychrobacillus sp. NPDC096623 TaxID=3364492 RepID=UPI0038243ABB
MKDMSALYLDTILEYGNISHAAKALYISQPYLSKYIKNIELELGVELVNRQVTPLTLTYAGERYLSYMKEIEEKYVKMKHEFEAISDLKKGRLTIGINPTLASYTLYKFLPKFIKAYPGLEIELVEETASVMESLLLQNKIDICLNMLPITNPELDYVKLYEENLYLLVPKGHRLHESKYKGPTHIPFNPKFLQHERFVLLKPGLGLRRLVDRVLDHYNIEPEIVLETENVENAFRLSNNGLGLTIIPGCVVERDNIITEANLFTLGNPAFKNIVVISYMKNATLSPAAIAFLQMTIEEYARY